MLLELIGCVNSSPLLSLNLTKLQQTPRGNLYPQVQEQLVKDHTRTESVMRDQGMKAIEAADQLSSDFVKLQDSRDRKR